MDGWMDGWIGYEEGRSERGGKRKDGEKGRFKIASCMSEKSTIRDHRHKMRVEQAVR